MIRDFLGKIFRKTKNPSGEDCPAELMDLLESTESKWRRGVIKEFIQDHLWKRDVENKMKWISRENKAILTLLVVLVSLSLKIAIFGV